MANKQQYIIEFAGDVSKFQRSAGLVNKSLLSISRLAAGVGVAFGGIETSGSIFDANKKFESLEAQLKTSLGTYEAAGKKLDELRAFATPLPISVGEATTAFIKLNNLGLKPSLQNIKSYGNTAAAMGKQLDQMIEAVADASVGEFERLKEFGIKASSQGDKVAFTFQGISKTVNKSSADIQAYLLDIGNNQFATGMDDQAKTIQGSLDKIGSSWENLAITIGQSGLTDAAKYSLDTIAGYIDGFNKILQDSNYGRTLKAPDFESPSIQEAQRRIYEYEQILDELNAKLNDKTKTGFFDGILGGSEEVKNEIKTVELAIKLLQNKSISFGYGNLAQTEKAISGTQARLVELKVSLDSLNALGFKTPAFLTDTDEQIAALEKDLDRLQKRKTTLEINAKVNADGIDKTQSDIEALTTLVGGKSIQVWKDLQTEMGKTKSQFDSLLQVDSKPLDAYGQLLAQIDARTQQSNSNQAYGAGRFEDALKFAKEAQKSLEQIKSSGGTIDQELAANVAKTGKQAQEKVAQLAKIAIEFDKNKTAENAKQLLSQVDDIYRKKPTAIPVKMEIIDGVKSFSDPVVVPFKLKPVAQGAEKNYFSDKEVNVVPKFDDAKFQAINDGLGNFITAAEEKGINLNVTTDQGKISQDVNAAVINAQNNIVPIKLDKVSVPVALDASQAKNAFNVTREQLQADLNSNPLEVVVKFKPESIGGSVAVDGQDLESWLSENVMKAGGA